MSGFGIVLLILGAALAVAEAHVPTHGAFGTLAAVVAGLGLALVASGAGAATALAVAAGLAAAVVAAAYAGLVLRKGLAATHGKIRSGPERLVGRVGEVRAAPAPVGQVFLDGALWRARLSALEDGGLRRGDQIVVERVDGLTLTVRRAEEWEVAP